MLSSIGSAPAAAGPNSTSRTRVPMTATLRRSATSKSLMKRPAVILSDWILAIAG